MTKKNKQKIWTHPLFVAGAVIGVLFLINFIGKGGLTGAVVYSDPANPGSPNSPNIIAGYDSPDQGRNLEIFTIRSALGPYELPGNIVFTTDGKERMRITKDGAIEGARTGLGTGIFFDTTVSELTSRAVSYRGHALSLFSSQIQDRISNIIWFPGDQEFWNRDQPSQRRGMVSFDVSNNADLTISAVDLQPNQGAQGKDFVLLKPSYSHSTSRIVAIPDTHCSGRDFDLAPLTDQAGNVLGNMIVCI